MKTLFRRLLFARSLKLSLRFIIPLVIALFLLAYAIVPLVDKLTLRWFLRDLDMRSQLVAGTLEESIVELVKQRNKSRINALFARSMRDERLFALGYCNENGKLIYRTQTFPEDLSCEIPAADDRTKYTLLKLSQGLLHVTFNPLKDEDAPAGTLVLVHDMSFIERRSADTKKYIVVLFVLLGVVVSMITVFVAHLSWHGWMEGVRAMLRGEGIFRPFARLPGAELQPLASDLRALLRTLDEERRFADDATITWTPDTLRGLLQTHFSGDQILAVSNREPYIHVQGPSGIEIRHPASGLVTAIEPVLRACSGTWIAHGSGSADRNVVDEHDHVSIAAGDADYTLRRIWLTEEEESGYYYGFANEGLWPLCHIAHVRPVFRTEDWRHYVTVNQRFADAVVEESDSDDPVVLVQDYHFALLPELIRQRLPRATVIFFWHIPWPNAEFYGICPWREELLQGMLGSTIIGFHTRFHCKNFLETVDRYLETRIEHESSTIFHNNILTLVESYPISIQWPPAWQELQPSVESCLTEIREKLSLDENGLIALGVDRLDYTKGILERLRAVEHMLEKHPELVGLFTFIQIAAPSRSVLEDYQYLDERVRAMAEKINHRFSRQAYRPVWLKVEKHEPEEVNRYYRAANVCLVTSLHDGMNLVAKEYVAARDDERGVLLLSQFTGAANELHEALIVNPYHIEQMAEALFQALKMPDFEQRERMRSMRARVRDFNIYRWAGRMLIDAGRIRQREKLSVRIGRPL
jgi:trehalose 6-phosphate synthase